MVAVPLSALLSPTCHAQAATCVVQLQVPAALSAAVMTPPVTVALTVFATTASQGVHSPQQLLGRYIKLP